MTYRLKDFLRDRLRIRGESPEQFAARSGLSASYIYFLLSGERRNPRTDTMQRIAAAFDMTSAELAAELEGFAPSTVQADPDLLHLISVWRDLSDERRESILTLSGKVQPTRRVSERQDASASRLRRQLKGRGPSGNGGGQGGLALDYGRVKPLLRRAVART